MSKLKQLQERMQTRLSELGQLNAKEERSQDEESRLDALLSEINELGPQIDREVNLQSALDANRSRMGEPAGTIHARTTAAEGAETTQGEPVDRRSPMQQFVESEQYKAALSHPKLHSAPVQVGSLHKRAGLDFDQFRGKTPDEVRALIYSGTVSASYLLPDVDSTIYRARERDLVMRDVLAGGRTNSDALTILQETGFTNSAAEVAEATSVSTGAKPESALTFDEVTFPVRTIAHWIPITRQMLADLAFMQTYIGDRLRVGIDRREDNQILNGDGNAPNLTGLLNTSGILTLDATYFTGTPVKSVGTDVENFNRVLRAKTRIRLSSVGGAQATFVVMNPADMEVMLTVGDTTGRYFGPGPFSGGGIANLWGLSVVESENITAKTALVGDGLMAAVVDRMDTTIYTTDSHSDFFIRNILVILAEERIALPVFRPAAFAKVTLA